MKDRATVMELQRLAQLKHGDQFKFKMLGDVSLVAHGSTFSRGTNYRVPPSHVSNSANFIFLFEAFYIVFESIRPVGYAIVLPCILLTSLLNNGATNNGGAAGSPLTDVDILRLMSSQLCDQRPLGVCYRAYQGTPHLCVYQRLMPQDTIAVLEDAVHQVADCALMILQGGRQHHNYLSKSSRQLDLV